MSDPTRRDSMRAEAREDNERRQGGTDTQVSAELTTIGGDLLEGSGFEEEEPDKDFL